MPELLPIDESFLVIGRTQPIATKRSANTLLIWRITMTGLRVFFCVAFVAFASSAFGQESQKVEVVKKDDGQAASSVITFRGHATEVTALAFSADGSQVVSASAKDVCIWEPATAKEIRRLKIDGESVVGFSRDFGRLAIARSFHFDVPAVRRGKLTLQDTANGKDFWSIEPHGNWDRIFHFDLRSPRWLSVRMESGSLRPEA